MAPMKLAAVVPIKRLEQAKSRLGEALDPEERVALAARLLRRTLHVLAEAGVTWRAVVSPDDEALRIAHEWGATALKQGDDGLNEALVQGREWARRQGVDALLALPADLPLLTSEDIIQMWAMAEAGPGVVIAPDHAEQGTNALLLHPPSAIDFYFGPDSFRLHCAAAMRAEAPLRVYRHAGTQFDLDTPLDVAMLGHDSKVCA